MWMDKDHPRGTMVIGPHLCFSRASCLCQCLSHPLTHSLNLCLTFSLSLALSCTLSLTLYRSISPLYRETTPIVSFNTNKSSPPHPPALLLTLTPPPFSCLTPLPLLSLPSLPLQGARNFSTLRAKRKARALAQSRYVQFRK